MENLCKNIFFSVLALGGLAFAATCRGLVFLLGFMAMYAGIVGLIKTNTDWLKEY